MNNQNSPIEVTKFQIIWQNFWNEEDFRQQTFLQLSKDFALAGIDIPVKLLIKCENRESLVSFIKLKINPDNIKQLMYIIDLKEEKLEQETNFIPALIQRVAFKVFLRNYLSTKNNS